MLLVCTSVTERIIVGMFQQWSAVESTHMMTIATAGIA